MTIDDSSMRKRINTLFFNENDKGLCARCGKPRPKDNWMFCPKCASLGLKALSQGYTKREITHFVKKATKAVSEDIRQTLVDPN